MDQRPIDTANPHVGLLATHWLGDTFWALQLIPFLRRQLPGATLKGIVQPTHRWLAELWLDKEAVCETGALISDRHRQGRQSIGTLLRAGEDLRGRLGRLDLLIDLTGTPASAVLVRLLAPRTSIGLAGRRLTGLLYSRSRRRADFNGHLAELPWWVLHPAFGGAATWPDRARQLRPALPGSEDARHAPDDCDALLLFPGAGWPQKRWPLARFVALAGRLRTEGRAVRMLFAESEPELADEARRTGAEEQGCRVLITSGPGLLQQLATAAGVVANDSGVAHLASALGLPTVALFGPTNPRRCRPLGPRVAILRTDCPQRPEDEHHHCHDRPAYPCPQACLEAIPVERVVSALESLRPSS